MLQNIEQYNMLYSCSGEIYTNHDPFVYEHALSFSISGTAEFYSGNSMVSYPEGSLCLARRNQLLKILKKPAIDGTPFSAVTIFLSQEMLKAYSLQHKVQADGPYVGDSILRIGNDDFMKGYFNSLMPYFAQPEKLTHTLAQNKTTEVIELLLRNSVLKNFLFDFNEPYKIDLQAYMNQYFSYNVPLAQFAKLTGRSLSTFKRDFTKIYDTTPKKWLQKRKLEQAYFLIQQKNRKPSDVYLDVGFESLSHFSYAFKNEFGRTPTEVRNTKKANS